MPRGTKPARRLSFHIRDPWVDSSSLSDPSLVSHFYFVCVCVWGGGGGMGEVDFLKSNLNVLNNVYSHGYYTIFTRNNTKEQNQTKQETLLFNFDRTPPYFFYPSETFAPALEVGLGHPPPPPDHHLPYPISYAYVWDTG